jgi:hypothetical protein
MAQKDKTQKILESYNDIFADIVNVLLFGGKRVVNPDDLTDATTESQYKFAGDTRSQDRDVAKNWHNGTIKISVIGFENQTDDDADMPLRIMGYDGAAYRDQIRRSTRDPQQNLRYPVVTMVLYFGTTHWSKPLSLKERLVIPEGMEGFVSDYRVNLFEIAFLSDKQVSMFRSDFRIIADYCTQIRKHGKYTPREYPEKHVQDVFAALEALTADNRMDILFEKLKEPRKGGGPMLPSAVRIMEEEITKGVTEEVTDKVTAEVTAEVTANYKQFYQIMRDANRMDDYDRAMEDDDYKAKLMKELGLKVEVPGQK